MKIDKLYTIYKHYLSPILKYTLLFPESGCKFYPTCSEYAHLAVKKHGFLKGALKGIWRLIRCSPLTKGGIDYP